MTRPPRLFSRDSSSLLTPPKRAPVGLVQAIPRLLFRSDRPCYFADDQSLLAASHFGSMAIGTAVATIRWWGATEKRVEKLHGGTTRVIAQRVPTLEESVVEFNWAYTSAYPSSAGKKFQRAARTKEGSQEQISSSCKKLGVQ